MTAPISTQPRKRSSWLRKLIYVAGGLLVLLVIAYFVVTSSAFFKGVILPRVSKLLGAQVTVGDASISPFSHLQLDKLKIQTTGAEPVLQADELLLRYSLMSILGGTIKVDEITIVSPVVQIIQNADGTSNLDPLMKQATAPGEKPAASSAPGKPPQIDLKNFALKNATIKFVKNSKDGGRETAELTGINITLDQLKNGQSGKFSAAAAFKMLRPTNDVLEAKSTVNIEFAVGSDLVPTTLKANVVHEILKAEGSLKELVGCRMVLAGDVSPTEVKELAQRFYRGDQLLGEIKVTGPLDLGKKEGQLKLEIASLDRQVLNLIGAPMGMDFGPTKISSVTDLALTKGGKIMVVNTKFNAAQFSITQKGQTTPPLDLALAGNVTVNTADQSATVQSLTLDGQQDQKQFLHGALSQPMVIAWGKAAATAGDSAFDLAITDFNIARWRAMLGDSVSSGNFSLKLNVAAQQGGKQLKIAVASQSSGLTAKLGATPLTQAELALKLNAQVTDFKKFNLTDYRVELKQQTQPALTVSGSANYDGTDFTLQTQIEAVMARLLGSGPTTPVSVGANLSGSFLNQALDLRELRLSFTPTTNAAKNELIAAGKLDFSSPGLTQGRLTVKADTLDLTPLYNALTSGGGQSSSPTPAAVPVATTSAGSAGNVEPEPMKLPVQFTADLSLGKVWLREINIQNCQMKAKVEDNKINVAPCQFTMNGGPVNATADLNLGVKGYTYVVGFTMDKVPLQPIADTFAGGKPGQYQGTLLANAQIKGAGVTGASLQKNLGGQASFTFTNANIQLTGPTIKGLLVPIALLLRVDEINTSPVNWLDARVDLGGGNINVSRCTIDSEAFEARTKGVIPIAEVLTNSPLNMPVEFALRRALAEKSHLLAANTPTNATYAALPDFIKVKGTIGAPKTELDKTALGESLLKSGVGIAEGLGVKVDPKAGNALQGIGGLLGGSKPATTNAPGTNAPPKVNPLDLFKKN